MTTIGDGVSDEDLGRPAERTAGPTAEPVTDAAGDLEFDEAWGGASSARDVRPEPQRDPEPTFEDPNDR